MAHVSVITIVDDDDSVRESLHGLLRSVGFTVRVFSSAEEFLQSDALQNTDCLLLDVRMTGISGIELQRQLRARDCKVPIIFISANGDDGTRRQALGGGAVAFLAKPLCEEDVLAAIALALEENE